MSLRSGHSPRIIEPLFTGGPENFPNREGYLFRTGGLEAHTTGTSFSDVEGNSLAAELA